MINAFKNKFGIEDPSDVIVCIGDWEQKKQMKFKEPTIGKGVRNIFRRNGMDVFLVDEHRTSKKCSICEGVGDCVKFKVRPNPRPYKDGLRKVHGLLRCKNGCGLWNRDRNGASNIYKISKMAIETEGGSRPSYLCRGSCAFDTT